MFFGKILENMAIKVINNREVFTSRKGADN